MERGIEVSPRGSFLRDELVSEVILDVPLVAYKDDHGYKIKQDSVFLYVLSLYLRVGVRKQVKSTYFSSESVH